MVMIAPSSGPSVIPARARASAASAAAVAACEYTVRHARMPSPLGRQFEQTPLRGGHGLAEEE